MIGYFLGKRKVVEDLHVTIDQDSLADTIFTSLCTMQENKAVAFQKYNNVAESKSSTSQSIDVDATSVRSPVEVGSDIENELKIEMPEKVVEVPHEKYFAQLVGFGTQQAANAFAQRLQKSNMPVIVKNRHSKTAKGKKITWYQVVTAPFNNKNELERVVDEIKTKERLRDVRIITC